MNSIVLPLLQMIVQLQFARIHLVFAKPHASPSILRPDSVRVAQTISRVDVGLVRAEELVPLIQQTGSVCGFTNKSPEKCSADSNTGLVCGFGLQIKLASQTRLSGLYKELVINDY